VSGILAHGHKLPLIFLEDVEYRANGEPFIDEDGTRMHNISVTTEVHIDRVAQIFHNFKISLN
jgi:hypothetical protein